jgi:hypothetical protein
MDFHPTHTPAWRFGLLLERDSALAPTFAFTGRKLSGRVLFPPRGLRLRICGYSVVEGSIAQTFALVKPPRQFFLKSCLLMTARKINIQQQTSDTQI